MDKARSKYNRKLWVQTLAQREAHLHCPAQLKGRPCRGEALGHFPLFVVVQGDIHLLQAIIQERLQPLERFVFIFKVWQRCVGRQGAATAQQLLQPPLAAPHDLLELREMLVILQFEDISSESLCSHLAQ